MIEFDHFQLPNGLKVLHHYNANSPIANINLLYDVGSKDESADKTGFAHLFEHLMFGGSANIPDYDTPLQLVGGENNAFTTNDYTNYYVSLPSQNIETAFWLESDRMLELAFTERSLEVQRQVVVEEYKQSYLNQPYGDLWLHLRPLIYQKHPYRWPTIGADIDHIRQATMDDVRAFFYRHYAPNNAILSVSSDLPSETIFRLAERWFGPIDARQVPKRLLPAEPAQTNPRFLELRRAVPANKIVKAYRMGRRTDADFHPIDLLSDILSNGDSARFYQRLVKQKELFTQIDAYLMGELEPSLFVISGILRPGVGFDQAEKAIQAELDRLFDQPVGNDELQKVKNKVEANLVYQNINLLNRSLNLALHELTGSANELNLEGERYQAVLKEEILAVARKLLRPENCSTIHYVADNQ